jgi:D-alanyl-D-alanine carboxypeptidase
MGARIRITVITAMAAMALAAKASAGPALLFDALDGTVLYAEDQDNQWHPASVTKIMTAYVVFEAIKDGKLTLETKITCSAHANSQPPTKMGLAIGAQISVEAALHALILTSANDAAVVLAEAVAGSHEEFVERMNAVAARLGMTRTKFVNANGLPAPEQVTTARDLAKLARAVVRDYPDYARLWSTVETHIDKHHLHTHNSLLVGFKGADGMKTGFTCDSGFNLVASATRDGQKLIAVVLGEMTGDQRNLRAANLLEYGFQKRSWARLFPTESIDTLPMAPDAKGPTTVRHTVISWVCGTVRREVAKGREKNGQAEAQLGDSTAKNEKKNAKNKNKNENENEKKVLVRSEAKPSQKLKRLVIHKVE